MPIKPDRFSLLAGCDMAAQNFKKEDWGNGDTKLGQNWHKNFQAWKFDKGIARPAGLAGGFYFRQDIWES